MTLGKRLWLASDTAAEGREICVARSPRIGVTSAQEAELRFFVKGSPDNA